MLFRDIQFEKDIYHFLNIFEILQENWSGKVLF